jgi:hypothetical protein
MLVRIIQRRWNDFANKCETVNYFNERFDGTRQEAHRAARLKYPLPEYTLGNISKERADG